MASVCRGQERRAWAGHPLVAPDEIPGVPGRPRREELVCVCGGGDACAFAAPGRVRKPAALFPAPSLQACEVPLAPTAKWPWVSGAHSLRGPTLPTQLRGQVLTSNIGLDLSPRWPRPAFSGQGRGKGRPWVPAYPSRSADRGPPSPQPGGRWPSPSTDPSPVWSDPLGSRARWLGRPCAAGHSKGRVGHWWGLGPGLPLARAQGSQTGLFTLRVPCPCPACVFRVWVQQQRGRKFSRGLENAASVRAPATSPWSPVCLAAGTAARDGGIASLAPRGPQGPREPTGRPGSCKGGTDAGPGPEAPDQ